MIVTIQVTKEDIKKGEPCQSADCPLALAIARHVKKPYFPTVGLYLVHFLSPDNGDLSPLRLARLPGPAKTFRNAFDHHPSLGHQPFSFQLDIPDEFCICPN